MRPGFKTLLGVAILAPGLLLSTVCGPRSLGEEPGRFGRFFRFGGGSSTNAPANPRVATTTPPPSSPAMLFSTPPNSSNEAIPTDVGVPSATPPNAFPAATAPSFANGSSPRILPQPRVSRAVTESDPVVTRIALARSNDGNQFGMFLQVYADGTVIDSEGVHRLSPVDLKPVADALQSSDLYRLKGHCGGPSTDFVEQVHLVVYERNLGRLRANAFSYSGNPQGCDHSVRQLHNALDALQAKLARASSPVATAPVTTAPVGVPLTPSQSTGSTISLTPIN